MGGGLGALGSLLPMETRVGVASLLSLATIVLGAAEVMGQVALIQCDRETPQRWIHAGALRWAIRNGLVLGWGATTRLGFWSWYVIPIGSLLLGDPIIAALLYGCYGLLRGLAVWAWIGAGRFIGPQLGLRFDDMATHVLLSRPVARSISGAYLLLLGAALAVAIGL